MTGGGSEGGGLACPGGVPGMTRLGALAWEGTVAPVICALLVFPECGVLAKSLVI